MEEHASGYILQPALGELILKLDEELYVLMCHAHKY